LIGRDSLGGGGTDRVRRSEAITHGTPFQKAAALVDLVLLFSYTLILNSFSSLTFQKVSIHGSHRLQERFYVFYQFIKSVFLLS